jgi:protein gp37
MTGRLEAMGQDGYAGLTKPGTGKKRFLFNGQFRTAPDRLEDPLGWKKPRMVFVNSMSDLFGEGVPFEFIAAVFGVMAACPQHTFQVLTKRADRMLEFFEAHSDAKNAVANVVATAIMMGAQSANAIRLFHEGGTWPLPNVWLGVSVENNDYVLRIEKLVKAPAAVRFLSLEPLLGPIDARPHLPPFHGADPFKRYIPPDIDWVIVGGESGPNARPCQLGWIADIVAQCKDAGVPCFVKQLGRNAWDGGKRIKLSGKGGDPTEWPAACREWPREWPRKVEA